MFFTSFSSKILSSKMLNFSLLLGLTEDVSENYALGE